MTWSEDHGPDRIYDKFTVIRNSTGEKVKGFVFPLLPETDRAAVLALHEYCNQVEYRAPKLAAEIRSRLGDIECENILGDLGPDA